MVWPQLQTALLSAWPQDQLGSPKPNNLDVLVYATGVGKVCCYLFPDGASQPGWVAKMPRSPQDNALLLREYGLLQTLRHRGGAYARATLPRLAWMKVIAGQLVAIEPYIRGSAMDDLLTSGARADEALVRWCLTTAIDWLLRSQLEMHSSAALLTETQIRRYLLLPIDQLVATARLDARELSFLDKLEDRVRQLSADLPLPLVFNHGDFQPANILLHAGAIHIMDWEFGEPFALPLLDVFGLLARVYARTHCLEEIDGHLEDYLAAFDEVFLRSGTFAPLSAEYIARACEALHVDPEWTPVLFALFLVNEANKYHAFLSRRAARGYVYLLRSRDAMTTGPLAEQLERQKNVWLLGHLACNEDRLVFRSAPRPHRLADWAAA
jgi:hypothetical protein